MRAPRPFLAEIVLGISATTLAITSLVMVHGQDEVAAQPLAALLGNSAIGLAAGAALLAALYTPLRRRWRRQRGLAGAIPDRDRWLTALACLLLLAGSVGELAMFTALARERAAAQAAP